MDVDHETEKADSLEPHQSNKLINTFKKPVLIGKIGRLPRKLATLKANSDDNEAPALEDQNIPKADDNGALVQSELATNSFDTSLSQAPAQQLAENPAQLPYKEPSWSGLPCTSSKKYCLEILKSGTIIDQIDLMRKSFWVFGRSPNCEICMAHPTISRYHAVLQYRHEGTKENPRGFYIYDLNSTHGTFLNKGQLKPRVYAPVKVGHMIKLGFSTRSYVLMGPEEDAEEESALSVSELKQQRAEKLLQKELAEKEALIEAEKQKEEQQRRDEERGIDWGLGEDADEETDLSENPYAQTNNEELYIDDPKKALRGFMEREGHHFEYDCTEQGFGQFLCKVELPLDDDHGRPIVAEVLHKGKKKEAVVQCALEACRILDRYGVLRKATHESRKRKAKNWEEDDYYDSDDDIFLDRTGSIEKKREKRMQAKIPQQPETYQRLLEKEKNIRDKIANIEQQLSAAKSDKSEEHASTEEDTLDSFMKKLKQSKLDKQTISKLKSELTILRAEHVNVVKLANLAKPADLPPLVINKNVGEQQGRGENSKSKTFPVFGKRSKLKVQLPSKPMVEKPSEQADQDIEEDDDDADNNENDKTTENVESGHSKLSAEQKQKIPDGSSEKILKNKPKYIKLYLKVMEMRKFLRSRKCSSALERYVTEMDIVLQRLEDLLEDEGRIETDKKTITAKKHKMHKVFNDFLNTQEDQHLVYITKEFQRLWDDIQEIEEKQHEIFSKVKVQYMKIQLLYKDYMSHIEESKNRQQSCGENKLANEAMSDDDDEKDDHLLTQEELEKRKKKNQKRLQQRKERAEMEKQKGYAEDSQKEDYNMWVPPANQTGDGRTTLNEKYGY